uniref:Protein FAM33A n=1 Tax=Rhinolophus ferrumequinum TaxID=59479 RepID=A0A671EYC9_RHIFE
CEIIFDKLELMFQKADSDLDYIQYRVEYEIKTNHPDSADLQLSPLTKEERTAAQQLKSHMSDLRRNGFAKGNSNREEINSREI